MVPALVLLDLAGRLRVRLVKSFLATPAGKAMDGFSSPDEMMNAFEFFSLPLAPDGAERTMHECGFEPLPCLSYGALAVDLLEGTGLRAWRAGLLL